MSQHINPTPKQTDVDSVNSKIGNVGSTNLQAQITSLNGKIGNVRNTDLQSQVTSLNSNVNTIKEITNYTLASGLTDDNLHVFQVGKIVVISGGVASQDSSTVTFTNGQALLTGLPFPNDSRRIFMGMTFESGTRNQYRLQATGGEIQAFWDTVVVPKNGQGLYLNVVYTTNQ